MRNVAQTASLCYIRETFSSEVVFLLIRLNYKTERVGYQPTLSICIWYYGDLFKIRHFTSKNNLRIAMTIRKNRESVSIPTLQCVQVIL